MLWPFNKYPGTDYETFNWEWILKTVKEWVATMQTFKTTITAAWEAMQEAWADYQEDLNDQWQEFIDDTYKDQITEILEDHPEWVTTVMDGAITKPKINAAFLQEIENGYVTPEMYGAVGNGITDDTQAIQDAFDTGKPVVGINTYKTTAPVTLTGNNRAIDFSASKIVYTGTDAAVEIKGLRDSTVNFGFIEALNGNGIHFTGDETADYSQYVNLYFHSIKADNACILADPDNTWCNEIRVLEGKMEAGDYGAYLNSKRTTSNTMVTGWRFFEVGFEGVTDGVHVESTTDWSQGYSLIDCRYAETQDHLFVANGKVERVLIIGDNTLRYDWLDLSVTTAYALFITPYRAADNMVYPAMYYDRGVTEYPLSYTSTPIDAATDLNTIVKTGEYYASSSVTNAPEKCSPYGGLSVVKRQSMLYQTWYGSIGGNARFIMAERTSSNDGSSWSAWQYITTQSAEDQITGDLNTVLRPGTYRVSGATNRPANCNDGGTLVVSAGGSNVLQEYTANVATGTQSWKAFRSSNNSGSTWNNWKYITAAEA